MERDELSGWLRLSLTTGVGNTTARQLLTVFGLPEQIFQQSTAALGQIATAKQVAALREVPAELPALLELTWQWLQADPERRRLFTLGDPAYPACLLNMEDPPLLLYGMGAPQAWLPSGLAACSAHSLAIVGSRNPTPQGVSNARQFALALTQSGLTIVSGLALGVDGAAHEGALEGASQDQLATVAVVGTGLDRVYPKQHFDLAHRIAQHGVLLSEYPLGTPPLSSNFPKRNRLIAGLTSGTLVVEAALKSGSLITARLALEQGKDVFAIPGSIHSTQARGCHALIKQGAKLVECAQDVLEEWQNLASPTPAMNSIATHAVSTGDIALFDVENSLVQALGFDPVGLDALQARTGLETPTLQAQLMALELQSQITRLPGGLFQRLVRG
jgi:DNA processing protein